MVIVYHINSTTTLTGMLKQFSNFEGEFVQIKNELSHKAQLNAFLY